MGKIKLYPSRSVNVCTKLMLSLTCVVISSCTQKNNFIPKRLKSCTAVLTKLDVYERHGGSYDEFEFEVNGRIYKYRRFRTIGYVLGDKFELVYDTIYPEGVRKLLAYKPVFLKDEKTGFTIGEVSFAKKSDYLFVFKYKVNAIKHERIQFLENEVRTFRSLSKGGVYMVEYWLDNPQRSILYYDQPILEFDTAIAEIINSLSVGNMYRVNYEYIVSSDTFQNSFVAGIPLNAGEKFKIPLYKSKSKTIAGEVLLAYPVFTTSENTASVSGELLSVDKESNYVRYRYSVKGKSFERIQVLNGRMKTYDLNKHSTKFKVVYSVDDPRRAIIYLDQPMN